MGFSVPSNTMLSIYNEIVSNGYVTNRPMLGISYYTVASDYSYSAIAWQNSLPYGSIVIASIAENNDLTNNGIQVGDIITGVNGKPLDTTDVLLEVIENAKVGDTITLSICRLDNSGKVAAKFDADVKLVEDKHFAVNKRGLHFFELGFLCDYLGYDWDVKLVKDDEKNNSENIFDITLKKKK